MNLSSFWLSRRHKRAGLAALLLVGTCAAGAEQGGGTPSPASGRAVYDARCANCHGVGGKGDGPAAALLETRPRDLASGKYAVRSTETGSLPTDDDLRRSIRDGLPGTAMPAWKALLTPEEIESVAGYIKSFSPRFRTEQPQPVAMPVQSPPNANRLENGRRVYDKLQCRACHGNDGRGNDGVIATDLKDDWGHEIAATDLSEPWTFRGGSTTGDVYLRMRTGMNGTPMPSYAGTATELELWDLASFVGSLARKPAWMMDAAELAGLYRALDAGAKTNPTKRGRHLVQALGCGDCHSPARADGSIIEEFRLAGGQRWRLTPFGDYTTWNLTSDKATGLGDWSDEQIKRAITRGIRGTGQRLLPFPMPWTAYANLKTAELDAIVAYLRTVKPISNRIPPPSRPNILSYLIGKFRMLILKQDPPVYIYPGNAGTPEARPGVGQ